MARLPEEPSRWLGRRAGDVLFAVLGRRRRVALANLALAFPELPPAARRGLARRSFQHLGLMLVELCRMLDRPLEETLRRVTVDGRPHLERVMADHGRALALTGHLGNWELLALSHRLTEYPLTIVVRPLDIPWLARLVDQLRGRTGVQLVPKRGAVRPVLDALRRGGVVALLLDQNAARAESVFVPFFGRPASTSRSLALLAARTSTPVLPVFIRREPGGRHRIQIHPPLPLPANRGEAGTVELTMRCTEAIERAVRATPDQWLWLHDRWRTRPPEEA